MNSPLQNITALSLGRICITTDAPLEPAGPKYTEIKFVVDPEQSPYGGNVVVTKGGLISGAVAFDDTIPFSLLQIGEDAEWITLSFDGAVSHKLTVQERVTCTLRLLSSYEAEVEINTLQLEEVLWDDVSNLVRIAFNDSENLTKVPSFLPRSVTDISYCFAQVVNMDWDIIQNWNTSNVKNMSNAFYSSTLNLKEALSWDFSSCENVDSMFSYCKGLAVDIPFHNLDPNKTSSLNGLFKGCTGMGEATISLGSLDQYEDIVDVFAESIFSGKGLESAGYEDDDPRVKLKLGESAFYYSTLKGDVEALVSKLNFSKLITARAMFSVFNAGTERVHIPKMENVQDAGSAFFGATFPVAITHDYPKLTTAGSMFSGISEVILEKKDAKFPLVVNCNSMFSVVKAPLPDMSEMEFASIVTATSFFASSTVTSNPPRMQSAKTLTSMYKKCKFTVDTLDLTQFSNQTSMSLSDTFAEATMGDMEVLLPLVSYTSLMRTFNDATWTGKGNIGAIDVSAVSQTDMSNTFYGCPATCDLSEWCVEHITSAVTGWDATALTGLPKWGEACGN